MKAPGSPAIPPRSAYYPNMDLLRYILALGVIICHFNQLTGYHAPNYIFERVGGFFVIAGFLAYPAYRKFFMAGDPHPLRNYCIHRARRLLPAYYFIVLACSFGLVFLSTLSPAEYFTSGRFLRYLLANILFQGWYGPTLPGVFRGEPFLDPCINIPLWTMKVNWFLYLSVPLVFLILRKYDFRRDTMLISIIILGILGKLFFLSLYWHTDLQPFRILGDHFCHNISFFTIGMLAYFHKGFLERHPLSICIAGLILWGLVSLIPQHQIYAPWLLANTLRPIAVGMVVLGFSLTTYSPRILRHRHNVSYEMYLFHWPVIQVLVYFGLSSLPAWAAFMISLSVVIILSLIFHFGIWIPMMHRLSRKKR